MNAPPIQTAGRRRMPASRLLCSALAGLMLLSIPGCYGRFPITNAIYDWNGRVTNSHIVNSIIMIVLAIVPVYGIAILVDAIIINTLEFWDGSRVRISQTYSQPDGTVVVLAPGAADNEAMMTLYKDDAVVAQRTFVRDDAGVTTIHDENGAVISHVVPDGMKGFVFTDADNKQVGELTASQIASLRANPGSDSALTRAAFPQGGN